MFKFPDAPTVDRVSVPPQGEIGEACSEEKLLAALKNIPLELGTLSTNIDEELEKLKQARQAVCRHHDNIRLIESRMDALERLAERLTAMLACSFAARVSNMKSANQLKLNKSYLTVAELEKITI